MSNGFLKSIGLGEIDLSQVEAIFDEFEMSDAAEHVDYLNDEEKAVFLAACFCSQRILELDDIVDDAPEPLSLAHQRLFDESCQWETLRSICFLMVNWLVRERLSIGSQFFTSIREDFLVFKYPLTPEEENVCVGCPYQVPKKVLLN